MTCQISDRSYPELICQRPVDDYSILDNKTSDGKNCQDQHVKNKDFLT